MPLGVVRPSSGVPSPCVSICRIDAASGLCEGCLRSLDEIAQWSAMTDEAKRAVWRALPARGGAALPEAAQAVRTTPAPTAAPPGPSAFRKRI